MTLKDIKELAKKKGVKAGKLKKDEIIRSIQRAEGNFDCFGSADSGICSQEDCLWRSDCLES
ncbi:MAG: SAP domain-containing protein [Nitrospiraceae bacterium]|nr:SAP domain-containing protein [Nitrospiraceae bacterium]